MECAVHDVEERGGILRRQGAMITQSQGTETGGRAKSDRHGQVGVIRRPDMQPPTFAEVVISPNTITMPVLVAVSQATCMHQGHIMA